MLYLLFEFFVQKFAFNCQFFCDQNFGVLIVSFNKTLILGVEDLCLIQRPAGAITT